MFSGVQQFMRRFRDPDRRTGQLGSSRSLSIESLEDRRLLAQTTGVFINNTDEAYEGFTLFNPLNVDTTYLINNEGDVINTWTSQYTPGLMGYLLPDGSLLRAGSPVSGPDSTINAIGGGGRLEWKSWDGELLWEFRYDTNNHLSHHDIEPIFNPDGSLYSVLMIAWERKTVDQANQAGRNPALRTQDDGQVYPDHIIEVKPILNAAAGAANFEIIWEWHLWEHLIQDFSDSKDNHGVVGDHPELVDVNKLSSGAGQGSNPSLDWTHANGISYNPDLDLVLLSVRKFSEFWVIDHSTTTVEAAGHEGGNFGKGGDLIFRGGQPNRYEAGPASDRTMWYQHDATWALGNDPDSTLDDSIVVFDNGFGRPGEDYSAALEIQVPEVVMNPDPNVAYLFNFEDPQYYGPAPDDFVSVYDGPAPRYFSPVISGAQRLPNGNTLVSFGTSGTLVEVNGDGEVVWEYVNRWTTQGPIGRNAPIPPQAAGPVGTNGVFKARRYGQAYFNFAADPDFTRDDLYPDHHDTIGLVNPAKWQWFLANHAGGSTDGNTVLKRGGKASAIWVALTGDWDGDGRDSVGLYNPRKNRWVLYGDANPNGLSEEPVQIIVGGTRHPGWVAVTGDWDGDGRDSLGLYNPRNGRWWLNNRNTSSGANDFVTFVTRGRPALHFQPIVGDWNGDGIDTVGFYNKKANAWHLYDNYNDVTEHFEAATAANRQVFKTPKFGTQWQPLAGDWDGDGEDSVGLYNPQDNRWYFNNRNEAAGANDVDTYQTPPAPASWLPLAGNWDGSGNRLMLDTRISPGATPGASNSLTREQVSVVLDEAIASLSESDVSVPWLDDIEVSIVDLAGRQLGRAVGTSRIELDVNAAGAGWFIDTTPRDYAEYREVGAQQDLLARPGSVAENRVDLLTVVLHEIGHALGKPHQEDGVMQGLLPVGARRLS